MHYYLILISENNLRNLNFCTFRLYFQVLLVHLHRQHLKRLLVDLPHHVKGTRFQVLFFCHQLSIPIRLIHHPLPFLDVRHDFDAGSGEHIVQRVTKGALLWRGI